MDIEISALTVESLQTGNPQLFAALKAEFVKEGAENERARIDAIDAVDSLGLDAEKFAELKAEIKADTEKGASDLIIALHAALAEQRTAQEEARARAAADRADDGANLAALSAQLNNDGGDDEGAADLKAAEERMAKAAKKARGEK